jgi:hypothetical protein
MSRILYRSGKHNSYHRGGNWILDLARNVRGMIKLRPGMISPGDGFV